MKEYNLIIVGGGAAGILCAIEANKQGIQDILLIAYLAKVQIKKCVLDAKAGEKLITI